MQANHTTLFVPLGIGKNVHWCAGYEGYDLQPVVEPFKVRSDRAGFERVTIVIDGWLSSGQYDRGGARPRTDRHLPPGLEPGTVCMIGMKLTAPVRLSLSSTISFSTRF
jgi:hypothetical protein